MDHNTRHIAQRLVSELKKRLKKNLLYAVYCKFSEVIPKKNDLIAEHLLLHGSQISALLVCGSNTVRHVNDIKLCVQTQHGICVTEWDLRASAGFFFFAHFFTESHCMTSEGLEYCLCVSWTPFHGALIVLSNTRPFWSPLVFKQKESHTGLERYEDDWNDFHFWVNRSCYVYVIIHDIYQFLSYECAIFRFLISAVLIRSEFTLDPCV